MNLDRSIIALLAEREVLQSQIDAIDRTLTALQGTLPDPISAQTATAVPEVIRILPKRVLSEAPQGRARRRPAKSTSFQASCLRAGTRARRGSGVGEINQQRRSPTGEAPRVDCRIGQRDAALARVGFCIATKNPDGANRNYDGRRALSVTRAALWGSRSSPTPRNSDICTRGRCHRWGGTRRKGARHARGMLRH